MTTKAERRAKKQKTRRAIQYRRMIRRGVLERMGRWLRYTLERPLKEAMATMTLCDLPSAKVTRRFSKIGTLTAEQLADSVRRNG